MNEQELKFTVIYGKHTFTFEQGSKAYIFHIVYQYPTLYMETFIIHRTRDLQ